MAKTARPNFRMDPADEARFKAMADEKAISLSEWVRRACALCADLQQLGYNTDQRDLILMAANIAKQITPLPVPQKSADRRKKPR